MCYCGEIGWRDGTPFVEDFRMATDGGATDDAPLFFSDEVADSADIIPKKRLEPLPDTDAGEWKRRYMGTFVLCGYSMTKGDGHAHAGDSVLIQRKAKNKTGKPSRFREHADYVVRFSTTRGFELGRIPVDVASWMARLLDDQLVDFEASIVDCPLNLEVGSDILLQVKAYMHRAAFSSSVSRQCHIDTSNSSSMTESRESEQERLLRHRKVALQRMFRACHLTPRRRGSGANNASSYLPPRTPAKQSDEPDDGTEISSDYLRDIYARARENPMSLPEVNPPPTFALELRPYQKQALGWMQGMEEAQPSSAQTAELHPLWEEYAFPLTDDVDCGVGTFYLNPYIGDLSLEFQPASRGARGGILADEMGLGKTVMLASLIHANRCMDAPQMQPRSSQRSGPLRQASLRFGKMPRIQRTQATLVVAPMSLLSQWRTELERASLPGTLSVDLYYGDVREQLAHKLSHGNTDVIITSYGTLTAEYKQHEKRGSSVLFSGTWHRVILDEAHTIKNRSTIAARAACRLQADRRWALTGTPIQNRLTDLYSLLRFLRVEPWGDVRFFNSFLAKPFASQNAKVLDIVQAILASILLRREKHTPGPDGRPIVEIPPKTLDTQYLTFSQTERDIYMSVYDRARMRYRELASQGLIGKNVSMIFAVLMRLRQAVCHPYLVMPKQAETAPEERSYEDQLRDLVKRYEAEGQSGDKYALSVLDTLLTSDANEDDGEECPFCMELKPSKCFLPRCMHHGCRECLVQYLQACEDRGDEPHCPVCRRGPVQAEDLVESIRPKTEAPAPSAIPVRGSTKLDALMRQLHELTQQSDCKGVIFSQFTGFLHLIQSHMAQRGYAFVRLDGRTSQKDREQVLHTFANEPGPLFLLMSLRAGGVGLNLTAANHVWLMDCWWNSSIEDQAIDRIHRLGQTRPVTVHRLLVEHTIEDRILEIQRRKKQLVDHALSVKPYDASSDTLENLRMLFD